MMLDEVRLIALDMLLRQKEWVDKIYNKKLKLKVFLVNDLVWKVILPMNIKDKFLGNGHPTRKVPFKSSGYFQTTPMRSKKPTQNVEL